MLVIILFQDPCQTALEASETIPSPKHLPYMLGALFTPIQLQGEGEG